jgi:hypothetical protein
MDFHMCLKMLHFNVLSPFHLYGLPWDVGIVFLKWLCMMQYLHTRTYESHSILVKGNWVMIQYPHMQIYENHLVLVESNWVMT